MDSVSEIMSRACFPQVTSDAVAHELDWYLDWTVNDNFIVSFVAAYADPASGRTDTFRYGMISVVYSY